MLTAWIPAERSTNVWGGEEQNRKDNAQTHHEPKEFLPKIVSHPHPPPLESNSRGNGPTALYVTSAPSVLHIILSAPHFVNSCRPVFRAAFFRAEAGGSRPLPASQDAAPNISASISATSASVATSGPASNLAFSSSVKSLLDNTLRFSFIPPSCKHPLPLRRIRIAMIPLEFRRSIAQ